MIPCVVRDRTSGGGYRLQLPRQWPLRHPALPTLRSWLMGTELGDPHALPGAGSGPPWGLHVCRAGAHMNFLQRKQPPTEEKG